MNKAFIIDTPLKIQVTNKVYNTTSNNNNNRKSDNKLPTIKDPLKFKLLKVKDFELNKNKKDNQYSNKYLQTIDVSDTTYSSTFKKIPVKVKLGYLNNIDNHNDNSLFYENDNFERNIDKLKKFKTIQNNKATNALFNSTSNIKKSTRQLFKLKLQEIDNVLLSPNNKNSRNNLTNTDKFTKSYNIKTPNKSIKNIYALTETSYANTNTEPDDIYSKLNDNSLNINLLNDTFQKIQLKSKLKFIKTNDLKLGKVLGKYKQEMYHYRNHVLNTRHYDDFTKKLENGKL